MEKAIFDKIIELIYKVHTAVHLKGETMFVYILADSQNEVWDVILSEIKLTLQELQRTKSFQLAEEMCNESLKCREIVWEDALHWDWLKWLVQNVSQTPKPADKGSPNPMGALCLLVRLAGGTTAGTEVL